jgi:hypothetical protein
VQGNFQPQRRNYGALVDLLSHPRVRAVGDRFEVLLLGSGPAPPLELTRIPGVKVSVHANLPEPRYHEACRWAHFVLPLTKPTQQPQYFNSTSSTSVHIGMAYELGFVLHTAQARLYNMPQEVAFTYESMRSVAPADLAHLRRSRSHRRASGGRRGTGATKPAFGKESAGTALRGTGAPREQLQVVAGDDDDGVAEAMAAIANQTGIWAAAHANADAGLHTYGSHTTLLSAFLAAVSTSREQYSAMRVAYKQYKAGLDAHNARVLVRVMAGVVPSLRGKE